MAASIWSGIPSGRTRVALAVALRDRVALASLTIIEAPAVGVLQQREEEQHYRAFRRMSDAYFARLRVGSPKRSR